MKCFADVTDPEIKILADRVASNPAMIATIISFHTRYGMGVTTYYGDGVVRMAEGDGINDLAVFVKPDGTHGRVHTIASMVAVAGLQRVMVSA